MRTLSVTHIQGFLCRDSQTPVQSDQTGQEDCSAKREAAWSPGQTENRTKHTVRSYKVRNVEQELAPHPTLVWRNIM